MCDNIQFISQIAWVTSKRSYQSIESRLLFFTNSLYNLSEYMDGIQLWGTASGSDIDLFKDLGQRSFVENYKPLGT